MMDNTNYNTNYELGSDILNTLEKHGVAIIPKLLNQEEIVNMNKGMWNYLEHITSNFEIPIDRNNKDTWRSFYDLFPMHSMLI